MTIYLEGQLVLKSLIYHSKPNLQQQEMCQILLYNIRTIKIKLTISEGKSYTVFG